MLIHKEQEKKKMKNEWENYGDVNFLEHGGYLARKEYDDETCKKYPSLRNYYEVIQLSPCDDNGLYFAGICNIDLEDHISNIDDISSCTGKEGYESLSSKPTITEVAGKVGLERFAVDIVSYYGIADLAGKSAKACYPCDPDDWFVTQEEAATWLKNLGWEDEKEITKKMNKIIDDWCSYQ